MSIYWPSKRNPNHLADWLQPEPYATKKDSKKTLITYKTDYHSSKLSKGGNVPKVITQLSTHLHTSLRIFSDDSGSGLGCSCSRRDGRLDRGAPLLRDGGVVLRATTVAVPHKISIAGPYWVAHIPRERNQ